MFKEVAGIVADGHNVVEVVFVIPFHFEFGAIYGAGNYGIECGGVGPEVVLDDGLTSLVFMLAAFLVAPPEVGSFSAALFALDASASGIVKKLDRGTLVHFDFPDAVVEVVMVFVAVWVFGHVATGIVGAIAGGEFVVGVVSAGVGLSGERGAGPVAVVVIAPGLIRGRYAAAAIVVCDAVAGIVLGSETGASKDAAIGEGFPRDLFVDAVGVGHGKRSDDRIIV